MNISKKHLSCPIPPVTDFLQVIGRPFLPRKSGKSVGRLPAPRPNGPPFFHWWEDGPFSGRFGPFLHKVYYVQ